MSAVLARKGRDHARYSGKRFVADNSDEVAPGKEWMWTANYVHL